MAVPLTVHSRVVRVTHWVNAIAILVMISSGTAIHNAHPTLPFSIPGVFAAGLGFIGALRWHFAAMWVVMTNGLVMIGHGIISGRYRHKLLPISLSGVVATVGETLRGKLTHDDPSSYNAVQRLLYLGVICSIVAVVVTGLAIWKPVQFGVLTTLFGDFDRARLVHFCAASAIALFVCVHVVMATLVPRSLLAMIRGH